MIHKKRHRYHSLCYLLCGAAVALAASLSSVSASTHIFWQDAKSRGYALTDKNPGPGLSADAIVHEGTIVSGTFRPPLDGHQDIVILGAGIQPHRFLN